MPLVTSLLERMRRVPYNFWAQFVAACIVAFLIEQAADRLVEADSHTTSEVAQSIFDVSGVYQQLVTAGPRQPVPRYTALIEIDPDKDRLSIDTTSLCRQRKLIATLIQIAASANAAVIVLDKYFDGSKCQVADADKKDTNDLEYALFLLAPKVPIVSGIDATPPKEHHRPELSPALTPTGKDSLFRLAVVNLDTDTRRLPLRWKLEPGDAEIKEYTNDGWSLALQSAERFDRDILAKNLQFKEMVAQRENPYISFLREDQFTQFYAGEILCLAPEKVPKDWVPANWQDQCSKVPPHAPRKNPGSLRDLDHRIVIIGERAVREDIHNSAIGEVPGFYLHANYIEALLDDRVFRPVYPLVNYFFGFLIFAAFEYILINNLHRPFWAVFKVVLLLGGTLLGLYLVATLFGYYLNPATVGLLAIAINLGHLAIARAERYKESAEAESHHEGS